ncbi:MAG: hypothetical protein ABFD64_07825 [Armatimonadota bacterium]
MHIEPTTLKFIVNLLLPFLVGLILKSPVWKKHPEYQKFLTADAVSNLIDFLTDKNVRREAAIKEIQRVVETQGVHLDEKTAGELLDALIRAYGNLIGNVKRLKK